MANRRARPRKTADVMARYKDRAEKGVETRRSPRGKRSSPRSGSSSMISKPGTKKSPDTRSRTNVRRGSGTDPSTLEKAEKDKTPLSKRAASSEQFQQRDLRIENMTVIPETPPRPEPVAGRKRVFASRMLDFSHENQSGPDCEEAEDSRKPSKKRRSFNTPPRGENSVARDFNSGAGNESSSSSEEQKEPVVRSGLSSTIALDSVIDESLITPVLPSVRRPPTPEKYSGQHEGTRSRFSLLEKNGSTAPSQNQLHVISTSSDTITRIVKSLNMKLLSEFRDALQLHMSEMHRMHVRMSNTMSSDIQDMRSTIDMVVNRLKGSGVGRSGPKTSLTAWEERLNSMTPHADIIFTTNVFARILCINTPSKVVEIFEKVAGDQLQKSMIAMQTLLFSLQPGEKKDLYSAGIGLQHSEFLCAIVHNVFYNVCWDKFKLFREQVAPSPISLEPENREVSCRVDNDKSARIKRPDWLKQDFIKKVHIKGARKFLETLNQSRKSNVRKTPGPDDIATHGVVRVYRLLRKHLHQSRENVRLTFFEGVGYLFARWSKHVKDTEQSSMRVSFLQEWVDAGLDLQNIQQTVCTKSNDDPMIISKADAHNKRILKELFAKWPSMILVVEHEVHVVSGGGAQRRHSGGQKRVIRKLINLIQVACNVVVDYTRVSTAEMYLRAHPAALKCIMIFAVVFRAICREFIQIRQMQSGSLPEVMDIAVEGFCLKDLMPGDNMQSSMLKSRCLRMPEKDYEALHNYDDEDNESSVADIDGSFEGEIIKESIELGIASI